MIIKKFKNYFIAAIMAFIFGIWITPFAADYFGDCDALKFMECEVKAADISEWEKEWIDLQKQMADEASAVLKKEITFNDEDVSEEEKSTTIKSYDINNAVPMWTLSSDMTMISDYHKNNDSLSGLIKWSDGWYIPAKTMTGGNASILLQREKDGYHVYGQYFGNDDNYIANTTDEIKNKIKKELSGVKITEVRNVSIPFYEVNLVYVRQEDREEKIIPYQAESATTLNDIGEEEGKLYTVSEFMSDMENEYDEYSEKELEQIVKENKVKQNLGGGLLPKKKKVEDKDKSSNYFLGHVTIIVISMILAAGVFFAMKFIIRKEKYEGLRDGKKLKHKY